MANKKASKSTVVSIRPQVHKRVKDHCLKKGYKVCFFVESAITQLLAVSEGK